MKSANTPSSGSNLIDSVGKMFPGLAIILSVLRLFYMYAIVLAMLNVGILITYIAYMSVNKDGRGPVIPKGKHLQFWIIALTLQVLCFIFIPDLFGMWIYFMFYWPINMFCMFFLHIDFDMVKAFPISVFFGN